MTDRTAEAEAIVAATEPAKATRTLQALVAAQSIHTLVMDNARLLDHLRVVASLTAPNPGSDLQLEDAVNDLDGSLRHQSLLIEIRNVLDLIISRDEHLDDELAHHVMTTEEAQAAIDALRAGPLGHAARSGVRAPVRRPDVPGERRVTGRDGRNYPGSTATAEAQRVRIVATRQEHPEWSARKVAREVGCSQNTVIAVDQVLAGTTS